MEKAEKWFQKGVYLNGLKLKPHESINKLEFAEQYQKNQELWDKAFAFLKEHNLDTIAPGKYPIVGDDVYASVTENPTKEMASSKWEFHKKYIDIQLLVKGKEKMGKTPVENLNVTDPYNETKDIGFGTYDKGEYYVAEPGTFFLFFPSDGHRPSLRMEGFDIVKKIVIKVRVE